MDNKITYHEQNDIDNTLKLREVLKTLPPFCRDYFRAIDATTTTKTRISYAYDIRIFFQFPWMLSNYIYIYSCSYCLFLIFRLIENCRNQYYTLFCQVYWLILLSVLLKLGLNYSRQ